MNAFIKWRDEHGARCGGVMEVGRIGKAAKGAAENSNEEVLRCSRGVEGLYIARAQTASPANIPTTGRDEYKIFRDEKKGMYDAMTRDVRRTQDQACRM